MSLNFTHYTRDDDVGFVSSKPPPHTRIWSTGHDAQTPRPELEDSAGTRVLRQRHTRAPVFQITIDLNVGKCNADDDDEIWTEHDKNLWR